MTHDNYDGVDLVTPKSAGLLLLYHTVNIDRQLDSDDFVSPQASLFVTQHS